MTKKRKLLLMSLSMLIASVFVFFTGCETMGVENTVSGDIKESVEMEEYIVAGLELQHSLNQFKEELKGIDMLALKPTLDSKENLVINLPTKISIEEKSKDFNAKKKLLLDKYPELKRMKSVKRIDHIKETVGHSLKIAKMLMEFEFSNQPRLRSEPTEYFTQDFTTEAEAFAFLDQQLASSNYVEVALIVCEDGTVMTYITNMNDAANSYYPTLFINNTTGKYYSNFNPNSPIAYIAHTHRFSDQPFETDIENKINGLDERIYTSGGNLNQY